MSGSDTPTPKSRIIDGDYPPPMLFQDVLEFMEKFGRAYDGPPRVLPDDLLKYRLDHMREELDEYSDMASLARVSSLTGDTTTEKGASEGMIDALVDLVYVTLQTAAAHGYDFDEAWRRVHAANMKKQLGLPTKRATDDIGKPPGWVAPDLSDLV